MTHAATHPSGPNSPFTFLKTATGSPQQLLPLDRGMQLWHPINLPTGYHTTAQG
jgi:hypothetical protein